MTMIMNANLKMYEYFCWIWFLFFFSVIFPHCWANMFSGCEMVIRSGVDNSTGVVTTPGFVEKGIYPPNTRCLFKFIGLKNERVKIDFLKFVVEGVMPECHNDYVDIWIEVPKESTTLIDSPLFGRYCGVDHMAGPKTTISLTNIYVIAFLSDDQYESKGLKIQYEFLDASPYQMGRAAPPNVCGWTIDRRKKEKKDKKGEIMTPNYPGLYPSGLFCFYKFKGRKNDRIRLDFSDFNLYGDDNVLIKPKHCPYDYVRIYDGFTNEAPTIGTYCWRSKPFTVFSSGNHLLVEFQAKVGHDLMNPGFKASYVISNKIVNLGFIEKKNTTHHIPGTECDQRVMSAGESKGVLMSPNHPRPFPVGLKCRYFVDGLENREDLEVALIRFDNLNIPTTDSKCSNGSVSVFVTEQKWTPGSPANTITKISQALDPRSDIQDPDYNFCGRQKPADLIVGTIPRTLVVFDSLRANKASKGFKAKYEFIKRYAVDATLTPDSSCVFRYNSGADGSRVQGTFHSPRNPGLYPDDLDCVYRFHKAPGEQLIVGFTSFQVETSNTECVDDFVEVRNVFKSDDPNSRTTLAGRSCGNVLPGPVASDPWAEELQVFFRSNNVKDDDGDGNAAGSGFSATYSFLPDRRQQPTASANCGIDVVKTGNSGGSIIMGDYGHSQYCRKSLKARSGGRLLLTINSYKLEGGGATGCGVAVLRIYKDATDRPFGSLSDDVDEEKDLLPVEICGDEGKVKEIVSDESTLEIEFVSSPAGNSTAGIKGFKLGWAEIKDDDDKCSSTQWFKCKKSGHCIHRDYVCDRMAHCGADPSAPEDAPALDDSDERENCPHVWPIDPPKVSSVSLELTNGAGAAGLRRTTTTKITSTMTSELFLTSLSLSLIVSCCVNLFWNDERRGLIFVFGR